MTNKRDFSNDVPDNLDEAKGRAKKAFGELTDNESLKREGETDEAAGGAKDRVDDIAESVKDAIDDVKSRFLAR